MRALPDFEKASNLLARRTSPKREVIINAFAGFIEAKLTIWGAGRIAPEDAPILGGLPSHKASRPLAEHMFVFLENKLRDSKKGNLSDRYFMDELIAAVSSEQILYDKKFKLFSSSREPTRATNLLLACTLNRIFADTYRYQDLRTAEAYQNIAEVIYNEGREYVYLTTGMKDQHPAYPDEMRALCRKLIGHHALNMAHVVESIDHHIEARLFRPPTLSYPANDI